jgi:membrane-associated phospholipid phosphatase
MLAITTEAHAAWSDEPAPRPDANCLSANPKSAKKCEPSHGALELPARYARFGWGDAVVTGLGGITTLAMAALKPIESQRRSGGVAFDRDLRRALRASSFDGRYVARDASDVILSLELTYPFFIDSLVTAWWFRGNADAARQMALIDAEAFAIAGALQGVTNVIAARERPYGGDCGGLLPAQGIDCESFGRYRSFFSGHSMFSFVAASLVCSHHMTLELFGNRTADAMSCVTGYLLAGITASLRIVGDMHYASDVIAGGLVGTAVGLTIPWLHYEFGTTPAAPLSQSLRVYIVPTGRGAAFGGAF